MLHKKEFLKYSKLLSDLDNVHSIPSLKGASLCTITNSSKSNSKSFKDLLSGITALELVSLQRPFFNKKKKQRLLFDRIRRVPQLVQKLL